MKRMKKRMKGWGALLVLCLGTACATATSQRESSFFRPGWASEDASAAQVPAQQYDESLQLLETATTESVSRALGLMMKSCEGGHLAACQHLEAHATRPVRLPGPAFSYTQYALTQGIEGTLTARCDVSTQGRVGKCLILEDIPELNDELLRKIEQQRFQPMRFHDMPVVFEYTFNIHLRNPNLAPIQRLYFARKRVQSFPNSPGTWKNLTKTLQEVEPSSTELPRAIERAFELLPENDWLLYQMAQLRARQGDMKAARAHALAAVRKSPDNSAYLDLYASMEAALDRCAEALRAQRRAVEELPDKAPPSFAAALRQRLADYEARCGTQG